MDYSQLISRFHRAYPPEQNTTPIGYARLIMDYDLDIPAPELLCAISTKHKRYQKDGWEIFTPRHDRKKTLDEMLKFAFRYEGLDLALLKALFQKVKSKEIESIVLKSPHAEFNRRLWFIYEWLQDEALNIEPITKGNYTNILDEKLQYGIKAQKVSRQRINNNLPGTRKFCPLIKKTSYLEDCKNNDLGKKAAEHIGKIHKDLLSRAAAFLLLKDSKASYTIENESPPHNRIERWGKIIGQAGKIPLSIEELERLQDIVIHDARFTSKGLRYEGGFVGDHDRVTGMPLPEHISAKFDDLESLLSGLFETNTILKENQFDPVLASAIIAFGFVFIHPFEDGNGRIHRYLIHHILSEMEFVPKGLIFPVSAVMLDKIDEYRETLESYSKPRLDFIKWRTTEKNNIEVLNDTDHLYRYFDATKQAEFLYKCVDITINKILPEEVTYLEKYDALNEFIKNYIDMPDKMINLLIRIIDQNQGRLSKGKKEKLFSELTDSEIESIESKYNEIFV
jgi:hypothetical protein